LQAAFGGIAPGNIEKPKKRPAPERVRETSPAPDLADADAFAENSAEGSSSLREWLSRLAGSAALAKTLAVSLAFLAAAAVALNWDAISRSLAPAAGVSPESLADPVSPLAQFSSAFSDADWGAEMFQSEYGEPLYSDMPFSLPETFYWVAHVVAPGETISAIAARHGISQGSLIALNGIREAWNLRSGSTIKIPNMNGLPHEVRAGDTLEGIALERGIPLNVLLDANDVRDDNLAIGQVLFIPGATMDAAEFSRAVTRAPARPFIRPVPGRITSGFGWREDPFNPGSGRMELHRAVDLSGRIGEPVRAAMAGTVLHRGANPVYGNFIVLQHGDLQTLYAHLSSFSVAMGESVRQGQEIGRVGNTGRTTAPHLHFAAFRGGEPVNPVDLWR